MTKPAKIVQTMTSQEQVAIQRKITELRTLLRNSWLRTGSVLAAGAASYALLEGLVYAAKSAGYLSSNYRDEDLHLTAIQPIMAFLRSIAPGLPPHILYMIEPLVSPYGLASLVTSTSLNRVISTRVKIPRRLLPRTSRVQQVNLNTALVKELTNNKKHAQYARLIFGVLIALGIVYLSYQFYMIPINTERLNNEVPIFKALVSRTAPHAAGADIATLPSIDNPLISEAVLNNYLDRIVASCDLSGLHRTMAIMQEEGLLRSRGEQIFLNEQEIHARQLTLMYANNPVWFCAMSAFEKIFFTLIDHKRFVAQMFPLLFYTLIHFIITLSQQFRLIGQFQEIEDYPEKILQQLNTLVEPLNLRWSPANSQTTDFSFNYELLFPDDFDERQQGRITTESVIAVLTDLLKAENATIIEADALKISILKSNLFQKNPSALSEALPTALSAYHAELEKVTHLIKELGKLTARAKLAWLDVSSWNGKKQRFDIKIRARCDHLASTYGNKLEALLKLSYKAEKVRYDGLTIEIDNPSVFQLSEEHVAQYQDKLGNEPVQKTSIFQPTVNQPVENRPRIPLFTSALSHMMTSVQQTLFSTPTRPAFVEPQWHELIDLPENTKVVRIYGSNPNEIIFAYVDSDELKSIDKQALEHFTDIINDTPHLVAETNQTGIVRQGNDLFKVKTKHANYKKSRLWAHTALTLNTDGYHIKLIRFCHFQKNHNNKAHADAIARVESMHTKFETGNKEGNSNKPKKK